MIDVIALVVVMLLYLLLVVGELRSRARYRRWLQENVSEPEVRERLLRELDSWDFGERNKHEGWPVTHGRLIWKGGPRMRRAYRERHRNE